MYSDDENDTSYSPGCPCARRGPGRRRGSSLGRCRTGAAGAHGRRAIPDLETTAPRGHAAVEAAGAVDQDPERPDGRRASGVDWALPVVVTRTVESGGTRVRFAVEGKAERASFFFPTLALPDPPLSDGGPTVPGRWKLGGDGSCYWDEYDSGPDQCTPPGGGGGTCYDGEPGPCATQQEMVEAIALGVYSENDGMEQEVEEAAYEAEINAYCAVNYCGSPAVRPVALGATACTFWPCWWKLLDATWETATYLWGARSLLKQANAAAAAGVGLSLAALTGTTVLVVGGGVAAGLALAYLAKWVVDSYRMEPVEHQTPLRGILGRRFSVVAA